MAEPTKTSRQANKATAKWGAGTVLAALPESHLRAMFDAATLEAVDKWVGAQDDPMIDPSEAIRRLVEKCLKAK